MRILTQIIGLLATAFSVGSFQMNRHKRIMLMQIAATVLFGVQYYMLGAVTGAVLNGAAVLRDLVFYNKDKKWAQSNIWVVLFSCVMAALGILTWNGWVSLLMIIGMVFNTISLSCVNPKLVRRIILISSPFVLVYSILTGSLGGIINELFVEVSTVIAMYRYDRKKA